MHRRRPSSWPPILLTSLGLAGTGLGALVALFGTATGYQTSARVGLAMLGGGIWWWRRRVQQRPYNEQLRELKRQRVDLSLAPFLIRF